MQLTTNVWPTVHPSTNFDLTTTSYYYDYSAYNTPTADNFWFLNNLNNNTTTTTWQNSTTTTTTTTKPNSTKILRRTSLPFLSQNGKNKTRGYITRGFGNSSAPVKRTKVTQEQSYTCGIFRRICNTYVVGLLCFLGIIGNIVSILVLQKDKNNKVAIFLLQSLAAADVILLIMSFLILSVYHGFMVDIAELGIYHRSLMPYIIAHVNPIGLVAQAMVIWCTVLLAINRYIAICKPFAAKKWLTMKWARVQVLTVFVVSILLNLPRHFIYILPIKEYIDPKTNNTHYFIHLQRTALGNSWYFQVYYFHSFYNAFVHALPLLLLVCINIPIIRSLQRSKRLMQRNSLVYSGRRENNITVIMVIIIVQLLVCHTPDKIFCIYRDIIPHPKNGCPHPLYFTITIGNIFVIINSSTDFIVYYLFRKRFRYYLKSRLCCIKNLYYGVSRMSQTEGDMDLEEVSFQRMHSNNIQSGLSHLSTAKRSNI